MVLIPGVGIHWAVDNLATPTRLYFYIMAGGSEAQYREMIGFFKWQDGTLVRGPLVNYLRGLPGTNDAVSLPASDVEIDNDANSPWKGRRRMFMVVGATAS